MSAVGALIARHIRTVFVTSKVVRAPADTDSYLEKLSPTILAMWHGQFLLLPPLKPKKVPVQSMVAQHADGEMVSRALLHFDMGLIRGAGAGDSGKNRGGAGALRAALKALRSNITVALTADVPPGPARVAGHGIVTLAKISGRPIVPLAVATNRFFTLPTWSRFTINLPFSKLAVVAGEPIYVPREADADELEALRQRVEDAMNEATARAYALAGSDARKVAPKTKREPRHSGFLLSVYRGLTSAARPAAMAILRRRAARGKEEPERLPERLGHASLPRPEGPLFWFHAASVGETNAVMPLIAELKRRYPALNILLTTVTVTSAKVAAARLPEGGIHQFVPLDSPLFVRRFLEHWRPALGLFTESEIWPNLIVEATAHKVPLVLVNGHMSQRSCKRWARLSSLSEPVFSRFDMALTQSWRIKKRLTGLGARNVTVTGNLKYDAPPPPVDAAALEELRQAIGGRPIFLAASTHPGEDEIIAGVHEKLQDAIPGLLTVIAPRHPNRGEAIAQLIAERGLTGPRRSLRERISPATQIYIADTIGELGVFYALAPLSFIGGSLVPHGGQNPIEAIKLGSAILSGPHTWNFSETYQTLQRYEGFKQAGSADDIASALRALFGDPNEAEEMRRRASAAIGTLSGALDRTLEALKPYLPPDPPPPQPSLRASPAYGPTEHAA